MARMLPLDAQDRSLDGPCKTTKLAAVPSMTSMVAPVVFYELNDDGED